MANPKPVPGVIRTPCRKCGGPREHFGTGVCWDCMGPAERERLAHEGQETLTEEQKQRRRESGHWDG